MFMLNLLKYKNRGRGFTLLEAMMSIAILGVYLGAMAIVLIMWRKSATMAKDHIAAINLARERIEWLKAQNYASLPRGTASVTAAYPYLTSTETVTIDYGTDLDEDGTFDDVGEEDELTGTRITQIQPINDSYGEEMYLRATVTVTWIVRLLGTTDWPTVGASDLTTSEDLVTYITE